MQTLRYFSENLCSYYIFFLSYFYLYDLEKERGLQSLPHQNISTQLGISSWPFRGHSLLCPHQAPVICFVLPWKSLVFSRTPVKYSRTVCGFFLSWLFVTFNPSEFPCFETISKLHKYCKTMQSNFFLNHVKKQVSHGLSVYFLQNKLVTLKRPQRMLSTKVNFLACLGNSTVKMINLTSDIPSTVIITSQLGFDH